MKQLRRAVFDVLNKMRSCRNGFIGQTKRTNSEKPVNGNENKNNNLLKELKGCVTFCLACMSDVSGKVFGRRTNVRRLDVKDFQNIAYDLAHKYSAALKNCSTDQFLDLFSAGMEGIAQGLVGYRPTKKTKVSTFLYSRAKFAIQKYFANERKRGIRAGISLNAKIDEADEDTEFESLMSLRADSVEETAEKRMEVRALRAVMRSLPSKQRKIVSLCSDKKPADVAKIAGCSMSDVKALIESVKEKMTQKMEGKLI